MQPVFRFAPSPNGELHLGHAYAALVDFELCRAAGGRFLLRMEDIDPARCRPEYEALIKADLAWLGLTWEEPVRRQSEHFDEYRAALAELAGNGADLSELRQPRGNRRRDRPARRRATPTARRSIPGSTATFRPPRPSAALPPARPTRSVSRPTARIALAGPLAWREEGAGPGGEHGAIVADASIWGDFVVARKEVPTSYHLAVVVDDAAQGVTHVVRGRDLFLATAAHVLLQKLLRLPSPVYHHHRLITDATGRKLAKSNRDTSLRALREAGATPADVRRMVGL